MFKTRWLWGYISRREYGFRPGRAFGLLFGPQPEKASEGELIPGWLRVDGWIDWVDFSLSINGRRVM